MTPTRLIPIVILLLAGAVPLGADLTIVQSLEVVTDGKATPVEQVTLYVSGKRVRFDKGQSMTSIMLADKKVTFSIMHEGRKYVVMPHSEVTERDMKEADKADAEFLATATIESTGTTDRISGYSCRQVRIRGKDRRLTELWVSDTALDMKTFFGEFKSFMGLGLPPFFKELDKHPELKGVPIRVVEYEDVTRYRRSTVTKLDTSVLDASVFEVPAGYAEIKRSDFPAPPQPESAPKRPKP